MSIPHRARGRRRWGRGALAVWLAGATLSWGRPIPATDFDIVLNEILYHPFSGDEEDEYIELYNRGPTAVDLSGWVLGEGVFFVFPEGAVIGAGEYAVVSPNRARAQALYGLTANLYGEYTGRLDNGGEILALRNAGGDLINRLHYLDGAPWPPRADGLGPSLELVNPQEPTDLPQSWAPSLGIGGTPGARNSRFQESEPPRALIPARDSWRYLKGTQPPPGASLAWAGPAFDDAAWDAAPAGFGYGNQPWTTELADMRGAYSTLYLRKRFILEPAVLAEVRAAERDLNLAVFYDDAFIAYLNGIEVGRANVGTPGTPAAFDAVADSSLTASAVIPLDLFAGSLAAGENVLAIQGLNNSLGGSDFLLDAELTLGGKQASMTEAQAAVLLNEIKANEPGGAEGFIEVYNASPAAVDLAGLRIADSRGRAFTIPPGPSLPRGGLAVFGAAQLGFDPVLAQTSYALVGPEGDWIDTLNPSPPGAGRESFSFGRYRDGGDDVFLMEFSSRGEPNRLVLESRVVINEIQFHPLFVPPSEGCSRRCSDADQWIEVLNRASIELDLSGWSLTKAVDFTFPAAGAGTRIGPGGYLVIAADRQRFLDAHPGVDPARVLGDWTRRLSHATDTINLRDALGNRVDHVKYGDGEPINDEAPADGIDDGTIRSSEWPDGADGSGRTLELIHPGLDNRQGGAWAIGPPGGTPAAANGSFQANPAAAIGSVENDPAIPGSDQPVAVTCRVSSVDALAEVSLIWRRDPSGSPVLAAMRDDGLSGDGLAGDEVFGASIPPQPDGTVVAYQIIARTSRGKTTTVPFASQVPPYNGFEGPFFLYQVLDAAPPRNGSEGYHVVMRSADLQQLRSRPVQSDVLLPCTFIAEGKAYQHVGLRFRGENSRNNPRKSYRIDFPPEATFRGIEHLNLQATEIHHEILAADLFRRAGLPYMQEWTVNLTFNGVVDPLYVRKESFDTDFLSRFFGGSDGGNLYRAIDPPNAGSGDLSYLGEDPGDYRPYYTKRSNREADDYSDLIELCRTFDPAETPDAEFPDAIDALIDVREWTRFFAIQSCLSNVDGAIQTGTGEDYLLYQVPAESLRPDAGKWLLLPWDIEETFRDSGERLFRPSLPAVRRFLTHPRFAPFYYCDLVNLSSGVFSRFEMRQRLRLIAGIEGTSVLEALDRYVTERNAFLGDSIPRLLSSGVTAASSAGDAVLIEEGDDWRFFRGSAEPSGGDRSWTLPTFDAAAWENGPTGIGYDDGDDRTVLSDMRGNYTSVYARKVFTVASPQTITRLDLHIDFDDGFVAYLNGFEVARQNAPGGAGSFVPFNATATGSREAGTFLNIDISGFRDRLEAGSNVLALMALNQAIDSSDLSLIPRLTSRGSGIEAAGCGSRLFAVGDQIGLSGRADACATRAVRIAGAPAVYDPVAATWRGTAGGLAMGLNTVRVEAFDDPGGAGNPIDVLEILVERLPGAPSVVNGAIGGDVVWRADAGPYHLTGDVTVPAGSSLAIEAGAVILAEADASLVVRGRLESRGTQAAPVRFLSMNCSEHWGGIALDGTGLGAGSPTHLLRWTEIERAAAPAGFGGAVSAVDAKLRVENSTFRSLGDPAIDAAGARVEALSSLFEGIPGAIQASSSILILENSTFRDITGTANAISIDGNGSERSRIQGCIVERCPDDGIEAMGATVDLIDNTIRQAADRGISLRGSGSLGSPAFSGNLIHDCGTALALTGGAAITGGHHSTLAGNQEGILLAAEAGSPGGGSGSFHSLIVWSNITDVRLDALSTASFEYSDIGGGSVRQGAGNISGNPRFRDALARDYSLSGDSPCIRAGKDGSDMGAIPFSGSGPVFIRGDADENGALEISDAILALDHLFRRGPAPGCRDRLDSNDDGALDIADPIYALLFLFAGHAPPPPPFPLAGIDPTPDGIPCE